MKSTKRFLAAFLLLALFVSSVSFAAPFFSAGANSPVKADGEIIDSGVCGDNITWELTDKHALILSGTGEMWDYSCYDVDNSKNVVPWAKYYDRTFCSGDYSWYASNFFRSVIVGEGITYIGSYAFRAFNILREVSLPSTLEHIGPYAFEGCTRVVGFSIPASVTKIDNSAFARCYRMTSFNIPDGIKEIESSVFYMCKAMETFDIPESVTVIGTAAFEGCISLKSIDLPNTITSIGYSAFSCCYALESIRVPDKVKVIPSRSFYDCVSLKSIYLPSITSVGYWAFDYCSELRDVYYPGSEATFKIALGPYVKLPAKAKLHPYYNYTYMPYCTVTAKYSTYGYTGQEIKPAVTVKTASGTTLKKGEDYNYTVSYENNVDYGTGKAVITGVGKYTGTIEFLFEIKPGKVKNLQITSITSDSIGISFDPVLNAVKYKIRDYYTCFETTDTSFVFTDLRPNSSHLIRVCAVVNACSPETGEVYEMEGLTVSIRAKTN